MFGAPGEITRHFVARPAGRRRCAPAFGRLRRLVELAYDFVGSSNLANIMLNKKGPENQVPFYMARPERFELPTTWFVARYSIQLSYGRKSLS